MAKSKQGGNTNVARTTARPLKSLLKIPGTHSGHSDPQRYITMWLSHLRGPKPNIFLYKHSGDHWQSNICVVVDPRSCQHLCARIALCFERWVCLNKQDECLKLLKAQVMAELGSSLIRLVSLLPLTTLKSYFLVRAVVNLLHSGIPFQVHLIGAFSWRKGN